MKRLQVDVMYLDLSVCERCQGADASVEEAVAEVGRVLETTGTEVVVNRIWVRSEEQARQLEFVSSPTIRVNGQDIQMDVKESLCESCGDLCGTEVDCRVWEWNGQEYTVPPKGMIVEALLREVYGGTKAVRDHSEPARETPDNLKRFFSAARDKADGKGKPRDGAAVTCDCKPGPGGRCCG